MLISGVKHACAKCIRGHRSSSCAHSDRPLFEIRKKGRPVSQCPHCRDLRKIKSSHTKCECGANPGEGTGKGKCQCHSGQPCICAGQPQVFQYIAPDLSGQSTKTAASSTTDGARTPTTDAGTAMLHTFNLGMQQPSRSASPSHSAMPPPSYLPARRSITSPAIDFSSPHESYFDVQTSPAQVQLQPSPVIVQPQLDLTPRLVMPDYTSQGIANPQRIVTPPVTLPYKRRHVGESSISRSTRSIGTNTDALPPGVWPEDPWEVPVWMTSRPDNVDTTSVCCPKVKDMPLKNLPFDTDDLAPATSSNDVQVVPQYTVYYGGPQDAIAPPDQGVSVHHYQNDTANPVPSSSEESEFQFDQGFWDKLMEVPGCSLPGVQCRCGDDCSCSGCQTHRDNGGNVAAAEIARMGVDDDDGSGGKRAPREHPAGCCDTRSLHEHGSNITTAGGQTPTAGGCCGGKH